MDDIALTGLSARCLNISALNLSWTGGGGQVTEQSLCRQWHDILFSNVINITLTLYHRYFDIKISTAVVPLLGYTLNGEVMGNWVKNCILNPVLLYYAICLKLSCRFLNECGKGLIILRLACCKYIGSETLSTVSRVSTMLEGLYIMVSVIWFSYLFF